MSSFFAFFFFFASSRHAVHRIVDSKLSKIIIKSIQFPFRIITVWLHCLKFTKSKKYNIPFSLIYYYDSSASVSIPFVNIFHKIQMASQWWWFFLMVLFLWMKITYQLRPNGSRSREEQKKIILTKPQHNNLFE